MAAARDQAARIRRPEPDEAEGEAMRDSAAVLAESLRAQLAEDPVSDSGAASHTRSNKVLAHYGGQGLELRKSGSIDRGAAIVEHGMTRIKVAIIG